MEASDIKLYSRVTNEPLSGSKLLLMDGELRRLKDRVYKLEVELAFLKSKLGIPAAPAQPQAKRPQAAQEAQAPQAAQPSPAAQPRPTADQAPGASFGPTIVPAGGDRLEENIVGTWFPRIGALAILIAAGFAFKYAIDRGLIGPSGRVVIGLLTGLAFIAWGNWAKRRGWERYAQAVTAGGIALLYLSILAAFHLYGLIGPGVAFLFLSLITALNVALAYRYDAEALAVLAVFGAFINPFLVSTEPGNPGALYLYVVLVDVGVVVLASMKGWKVLEFEAFGGTWIAFLAGVDEASLALAFPAATIFFSFFLVVPFIRSYLVKEPVDEVDLWILVPNAFIYLFVGLYLLRGDESEWRSPFVLSLAVAHLIAGLLIEKDRKLLKMSQLGLSILFFTAWVPIQFDGFLVTTAWALKGVVLIALGRLYSNTQTTRAGMAVVGLGFIGTLLMLEGRFDPPRLLFSIDAANVLVTVLATYGVAWMLQQSGEAEDKQLSTAWSIAASILTVGWLSAEISVSLRSEVESQRQVFHFALSATWTAYATAILIVGVATRTKWARLFGAGLLGLTLAKMATVDLWTLEAGHRILAFMGMGMVLLLTSLMYHRFKEFLLGEASPQE